MKCLRLTIQRLQRLNILNAQLNLEYGKYEGKNKEKEERYED